MPRPSPRNGAVIASTSPRYSVSAITMPAISAPSTAEKPIADVTMLATITTSRQAARNTSGFLVRAACANRIGSSSRPPNSRPSATAPPSSNVPSSGPTPGGRAGRHRAEREHDRHQREILEQQHAERGAARPRSASRPAAARSRSRTAPARGRGRSSRECPGRSHAGRRPMITARADQLGGADAEHDPPHRPQAPEATARGRSRTATGRCRARRRARPLRACEIVT